MDQRSRSEIVHSILRAGNVGTKAENGGRTEIATKRNKTKAEEIPETTVGLKSRLGPEMIENRETGNEV